MYKNANFEENRFPERVQSFSQSFYNPDYGAYIHFFEAEKDCPAYKKDLSTFKEHLQKFKGVISLDNSIEWCAPLSEQQKANDLNLESQKFFQDCSITFIRNIRFGDANSYPFCFANIQENATIIIGSHGTQKRADYKAVFNAGACTFVKIKRPKLLMVYGTVPQMLMDVCINEGTSLIRYPSQCEIAHTLKSEFT